MPENPFGTCAIIINGLTKTVLILLYAYSIFFVASNPRSQLDGQGLDRNPTTGNRPNLYLASASLIFVCVISSLGLGALLSNILPSFPMIT